MLTEIADPIGRIELTDLDLEETAATADLAALTGAACTVNSVFAPECSSQVIC
ncbi:hypothetical protein [Amycolatopsis minnesotensis]|uniref:Lantibiotic n=1 Tax=Amycolatopsis minnesotensis TaxID=337894 RepID=A0ABN2SNG1_9PSEU